MLCHRSFHWPVCTTHRRNRFSPAPGMYTLPAHMGRRCRLSADISRKSWFIIFFNIRPDVTDPIALKSLDWMNLVPCNFIHSSTSLNAFKQHFQMLYSFQEDMFWTTHTPKSGRNKKRNKILEYYSFFSISSRFRGMSCPKHIFLKTIEASLESNISGICERKFLLLKVTEKIPYLLSNMASHLYFNMVAIQ